MEQISEPPNRKVVARVESVLRPRFTTVQRALAGPVRDQRMTVVIGRLLGSAFIICFLTGVYSHLQQNPLPWLALPTRPEYLYAWTQGIHVTVGSVLVPLLLAKLWVVFPQLFTWPPVTSIANLIERLSVLVLVSAALALPVTGIVNVLKVYPWDFSFRRTHFALAWIVIGALCVHLAVKLPIIVANWRAENRRRDAEHEAAEHEASEEGASDA